MLSRPLAYARQGARSFSATAPAFRGVTSNVGRAPIPVPPNITLEPTPERITVTGPLGSTSVLLEPYMSLTRTGEADAFLALAVEDSTVKKQRQMWGLTRTLIANAITGMTEGFRVPLYLVGVGYRAAIEDDPRGTADGNSGRRLNMKLGYSHSVFVPIPTHITAEVPMPTNIVLSCTDKHQLGLFAAKIREHRKPEPYKGKGIFVGTEQIRIKSIKKK